MSSASVRALIEFCQTFGVTFDYSAWIEASLCHGSICWSPAVAGCVASEPATVGLNEHTAVMLCLYVSYIVARQTLFFGVEGANFLRNRTDLQRPGFLHRRSGDRHAT